MCVKDAQCHRARDALHKARDALHKARDALSRSHGVSFAHILLHAVFCRASRVFCTRIYLVCLPPVSIVCVDLEPVEQTLYSATVPIKKSTHIYKVCRTPVSTCVPMTRNVLQNTRDLLMSRPCVDESFMRVTWLIYVCDMTYPCVRNDSVVSYTQVMAPFTTCV